MEENIPVSEKLDNIDFSVKKMTLWGDFACVMIGWNWLHLRPVL